MFIALLVVLTVLGLVGGLATAGLWMCWSGWLGRVVDEHPRCVHCRYDLYGHGLLPNRCPECGETLTCAEAMYVGKREVCVDRVAGGALCLALAMLPIGWLIYDSVQAAVNVAAQNPPLIAQAQPAPMRPAVLTWHERAMRSGAAHTVPPRIDTRPSRAAAKRGPRSEAEYELEDAERELRSLIRSDEIRAEVAIRPASAYRDESIASHRAGLDSGLPTTPLIPLGRLIDGSWHESRPTREPNDETRRAHIDWPLLNGIAASTYESTLTSGLTASVSSRDFRAHELPWISHDHAADRFASSNGWKAPTRRSLRNERLSRTFGRASRSHRIAPHHIPSTQLPVDRW